MKKAKNVFFVDPMSFNNLSQYDYNLLSHIKSDTVIMFFGNMLYDRPSLPNVTFKPIFCYNKYSNAALKAVSYLWSMVRLCIAVVLLRPQAMHIEWVKMPAFDLLFLRLFRLMGVRVYFTAHNVLPHEDIESRTTSVFRNYYRALSGIIVHSAITAKEIREMFGIDSQKLHVIPHGLMAIDNNSEQMENLLKDYRTKYAGKMVLTCIGNQSYYKGIDLVKRLWQEPDISQNPVLHLIIAGKKSSEVDFNSIEHLKNVTIIDRYLNNDEYMALMRLSDILLLPYLKISQSGVLMSAIHEHVPFMVSHVGALPEPLQLADVGWDIGEPVYENLRQTVSQVVSHPETISEKRNNAQGWQTLAKHYSWEEAGQLTGHLYLQ